MSRTGIPVARSLVSSDSQSRSLSRNRRRPSLPRSMWPRRPMRSYQRRVCWDRPHFSAVSRMVQVVTSSSVGVRARSNANLLWSAGPSPAEGDGALDREPSVHGGRRDAIVEGMTVFDDLGAEQERLASVLGGLDEAQWMSA